VWVEDLSTPFAVQAVARVRFRKQPPTTLPLRIWFGLSETATNRDCTGMRCSVVEIAQLEQ
jgi:hypothetical protein